MSSWEGVRYVAHDPPVRALMILSIVPHPPRDALPVAPGRLRPGHLKVGDGGLGVLQAGAGIGGIPGRCMSLTTATRSASSG
jgi:hypothetical protein